MSVIGIPKETVPGETRVALVPAIAGPIVREQHTVLVEKSAGERASFPDDEYVKAGATIVSDPASLYAKSDGVSKVQPPQKAEAGQMRQGQMYIGFLAPLVNHEVVATLANRGVTAFSMEYIPRI